MRRAMFNDFRPGTVMLFQQATAPVGWVKLTTHDNKALRIVSGTPSSGGTNTFTDALGGSAAISTDSHTLTDAEIPKHTHPVNTSSVDSGGITTRITTTATSNAATPIADAAQEQATGDGAHAHTLSIDIAYVDVLAARKVGL